MPEVPSPLSGVRSPFGFGFAGEGGGSGSLAWRSVSASNRLGDNVKTINKTGKLDAIGKSIFVIGSGQVDRLVVSFNNWATATSAGIDFPANAIRVKEAWLIPESGTAVQLSQGGDTDFILAAGANDLWSQEVFPADLGAVSIDIGDRFTLAVRYSAVDGDGLSIIGQGATIKPTAIGTVVTATATEDLYPTAKLKAFGAIQPDSSYSSGGGMPPFVLLGVFRDGDPAVIMGVGDSIMNGHGDDEPLPRTGLPSGMFARSLLDSASAPTNYIAGLNISRPSGDARSWLPDAANSAQDVFSGWCKYCNVLLERYGVNNRSYPSQYEAKEVIWDVFYSDDRVGATFDPVVVAVDVTGQTTSTDAFATLQNQTLSFNTGPDSPLASMNSAALAAVGADVDIFLETLSLRGSSDSETDDYWRWSVIGGARTDDGLHPNTDGHEAAAAEFRALYTAQGWWPA